MTKPYAHPEKLVSTEWVDANRSKTHTIRIVESNEDILVYETGHIPEAVKIDWHSDLQRHDIRDYITPEQFADLCGRLGIGPETLVVFYGDKSNWWAAYALWAFTMFGHDNCVLMDGGRTKWQAENRQMTKERPAFPPRDYPAPPVDLSNRAFRDEVLTHQQAGRPLIDVRSPKEFTGELTHMPDYPQEGALRGGHIPGAANVPWAKAANDDGTFKSREELERLFLEEAGLTEDDDVVAYCRIGERSSHTWFALKYLLGFQKVRNYDGSWTEWGNLVGMPIETGPARATAANSPEASPAGSTIP
jgi:thiosulfate/3-mercaptopyruvate sulfurtransferase